MILPEMRVNVIRYPEVDSTNTIALAMGNQGAAHGTVVQADVQTGGRGRLSRHFSSPPGGLYVSVILRPGLSAGNLPLVTLAAGVAVAEAIEKTVGIQVFLKWPNDIYLNDKKMGGILVEAAPYSHASSSIPYVVAGIGLNVNTERESFPDSLQDFATSLYCQTGLSYDIDMLLQSLIDELLQAITILEQNPEYVLASWQERDYLLSKQLCWQVPRGKDIYGTGMGLLPDGRYCLASRDGQEYQVLSGDITLTEIEGRKIK